MKRNLSLVFTFCLLAVVCSSCRTESAAVSNTASEVDKRLQGASRFERNGWVYVHLEGAPGKIGYQHGSLLAKEIEDLLRVMKPMMTHSGKYDWDFLRDAAERMLWPKMDKEYQDEIDGVVAGVT